MNITDFFNNDYSSYGSYDNYRKIANIVDGNKPSSRKCLYIILKDNINEPFKVQNLCARVSEKTNYIHGASSLYGVIVRNGAGFRSEQTIFLYLNAKAISVQD